MSYIPIIHLIWTSGSTNFFNLYSTSSEAISKYDDWQIVYKWHSYTEQERWKYQELCP